jgi:hypothetical protein
VVLSYVLLVLVSENLTDGCSVQQSHHCPWHPVCQTVAAVVTVLYLIWVWQLLSGLQCHTCLAMSWSTNVTPATHKTTHLTNSTARYDDTNCSWYTKTADLEA